MEWSTVGRSSTSRAPRARDGRRRDERLGGDAARPAAPSGGRAGGRTEVVRRVREQLRIGAYRPPPDRVAEEVFAWVFAGRVARP